MKYNIPAGTQSELGLSASEEQAATLHLEKRLQLLSRMQLQARGLQYLLSLLFDCTCQKLHTRWTNLISLYFMWNSRLDSVHIVLFLKFFLLFCNYLATQCFCSAWQASLKSKDFCCQGEKVSHIDIDYLHWNEKKGMRSMLSQQKKTLLSFCMSQWDHLLYMLKWSKPQSFHSLPSLIKALCTRTIKVQSTPMYGSKNCTSALQADSKSWTLWAFSLRF